MRNIKPRTLIIIFAIIIVFIVTLVVYLLQKGRQTELSITNSVPQDNATEASVFNPITITFNQSVDAKNVTVFSDPSENWTVSQTGDSTTIRIDHEKYLSVATKYELAISVSNKSVGKITFQTAHEKNDPRLLQDLKSDLDNKYPLASQTPYQTPNYRIIYVAPLTLEIDITGSIAAEDAIAEVKSWVQQQGIDPTTHKYTTKIVASPQP